MFLVPMTRQAQDLSRGLDRFFDDNLLDRFLPPATRAEPAVRSPALDVSETDTGYTVKLDMPGVPKEDVKISVDGRRVTVEASATRQQAKKDGERVVYSERSTTHYARSFLLPVEVHEAESGARLEHGVLTLTLAKRGAPKAVQLRVE